MLFRRGVLSTSTSVPICISDCCSLRSVRATLKGPVARKHFQAMSIARWGEGCRCRYLVKDAASPAQQGGGTKDDGAGSANSNADSGEKDGEGDDATDNSGSREDADWLTFYLRRVRHRVVRSSPLDLLQVRNPTRRSQALLVPFRFSTDDELVFMYSGEHVLQRSQSVPLCR